MIVKLECPVAADVDASGRLSLIMPTGGVQFTAEHTGMWIELRRQGGDVDEATETLSRMWDTDPAIVSAEFTCLVSQLCEAGLASVA